MQIKNGSLGYTLTLDNKQVQQILAQTRADFARTTDYATAELNKIQFKMSSIATLGGTFLSVSAAKGFVTELIHVRGEFQQIENAIETITGSQEAMNGLMTEWKDLTLRSPFRLSEIAQSGKQLLAYGVEVEKVTGDIEMLGNIASGVSAPINDIAYLYGTLKTQGRAYQQDINQFTGRGIPIIKELAKQFGVAESEVRAMTEAGKIGFPEVEKALKAMTSEGGQFFNLIGKQATTLTGAVNRLKHEIELMFNEIGTDTEGLLSGGINVVTHLVENYKQIGEVLKSLIITYGAYKAAVIVASTYDTARAKTIASEIALLPMADKLQLARLKRNLEEANSNLALVKSEYDVISAKVKGIQSSKASAIVKRNEVLASLNAAHAAKAEAQAQVVAAETKYLAYKGSIYTSQEKIALQELETAKTNLNTQSENVNSLSKAYNAEKTKVETLTKEANILATEQSTVATGLENTQKVRNQAYSELQTVSNTKLTLSQNLKTLAVQAATKAEALLNATMLNNPVVLLTLGFITFATILYKAATALNATEKAQQKLIDAGGEAQKSIAAEKLELERLIEISKDETKSKKEREEAIKKINEISPQYLGQLSLEKINTIEATNAINNYTEALYNNAKAKALQSSYEGLVAQEQDVWSQFYKDQENPNLVQGGFNTFWKVFGVETNHIKNELDLRNEIISRYGKQAVKDTKTYDSYVNKYLKSAGRSDLADIREQRIILGENLKGMTTDLEKKNKEDDEIQTRSTAQNKAYWTKIKDEASSARDALADSAKGGKEWTRLTKIIDNANKKLELYNDSYKKPKKDKEEDPVEIFKKQVNGIKEQYDRYVSYINTDDIILRESAKIINSSLTSKGANYEEYLRNIQKQLAGVTNKTKVQVKELQFVNDELAKIIDYNAFDKYKDGINEQIDSSENLLQVIGLLQEEKQKFANSSNPIEQQKFKFLDEKEIENIKKADDAAKSLINTLKEEFNPLETINKRFDAEIQLLKLKLEKAKTDIEKQEIVIAIKQVETKRTEALEDTPTNDKYVNEILKKYQTLEQKKQKIIDDSNREIKRMQDNLQKELNKTGSVSPETITQYENVIKEIKDKQIEAVSAVDSEILKKSDDWVRVFEDYSNKSSKQISSLIKDIEAKLSNKEFVKGLKLDELKAFQDRLIELKRFLNQDDPFIALSDSIKKLSTNFRKANGDINFEGIREVIDNAKNAVNETLNLAEDLGVNVSESTRDAVELGAELFKSGTQIAEGISSGNPVQVIQGLAKAVKSVLNFNDKKKQRQIKQYQQAVDDLARSFKNLQYETDKALGGDTYKNQRTMLDNLTKQQEEYRKMIKTEQSRKKTDNNKIKEWQQAIVELDQSKRDLLDSLAQDILQTNAKDLANTLGDALAEAFGKGEDAAKSFEKVANDVLKNAVLNQLKNKFLEDELKGALDQLYKDMGADGKGNFDFNGLTPEEQEKFRERLREISKNFSGALEMYSDLFKDLEMDPNENSLSGSIAGVSEETASLISGQMNAVRILIVEANKQRDLSNKLLLQQLDRLANIDYNTRSVLPLLERLINRIDNAGRAYGF